MSEDAAQRIRKAIAAFAPRWVDPPVLQPAGLYLELLGEDLRARAFLLAGNDDAPFCLRPDMTAPAVRVALASGDWSGPSAVAYDGPVFRRQSDAARESEFRQVGVERFAHAADLEAQEAALIAAALGACQEAGAKLKVRLGDVGVFHALVDACAIGEAWTRRLKRAFARPSGLATTLHHAANDSPRSDNAVAEALAALAPARAEAVVEELLADARIVMVGSRDARDIATRLREKGAAVAAPAPEPAVLAAIAEAVAVEAAPDKAFAALSKIAAVLPAPQGFQTALERAQARWRALAGTNVNDAVFSVGFGRGLAFYDGFVFEIEAPALGARASLGGGGRYDGLLHRLAAAETAGPADVAQWGALGFALRPLRIAEASS